MKTIEEILKNPRISLEKKGIDGFRGTITMPLWAGSVICSNGAGWEHVSVSPFKKRIMPTWDEMSLIKKIFWNDDEAVIQVHPPKDEYVNNMPNCLHLWRCTYRDMVLPPSCLVGLKEGQTPQEMMEEVKAAYALAGEVWNG